MQMRKKGKSGNFQGNISWLFTGDMEEEEVMLQQPSQSTPVAPQVSEPKEDD